MQGAIPARPRIRAAIHNPEPARFQVQQAQVNVIPPGDDCRAALVQQRLDASPRSSAILGELAGQRFVLTEDEPVAPIVELVENGFLHMLAGRDRQAFE